MPQLNPEFFISQLFWLFVTFTFLLVFLWRISLPRISIVLEKRQRKINDDIATAKKLQEEAEEIQNLINEDLKKAKSESAELLKKTSLKLQEHAENELSKVDKELDKKINDSQSVIEKNKIDSLSLVNDQIQEITKLTLSKVTSFKVTNEDIKKAILNAEKKIN
mgnify:FL=1